MQTLPRKIMEQCRLCPAISQSLCSLPRKITETLFFVPQNNGGMQTLLRAIMETQFQGPANIIQFKCLFFFLNIFVNHCHFRDLYNHFGPLCKEKIFCVTVRLRDIFIQVPNPSWQQKREKQGAPKIPQKSQLIPPLVSHVTCQVSNVTFFLTKW